MRLFKQQFGFIYHTFSVLGILMFFAFPAKAIEFDATNTSDLNIYYSVSNGFVTVDITTFYEDDCFGCFNDFLLIVNMSYKNDQGAWISFAKGLSGFISPPNESCDDVISITAETGQVVSVSNIGACGPNSRRKRRVVWKNLPQYLYDNASVEIKVSGVFFDDGFGGITGDDGSFNRELTLTMTRPNTPAGFTASTTLCNDIKVEWDKPSNIDLADTMAYLVSVPDQLNLPIITDPDITNTSLSVLGVPVNLLPGQSVEFELLSFFDYEYGFVSSANAAMATGNSRNLPPAPEGFAVLEENCSGEIKVDWNKPSGILIDGTVDGYRVQRSTDANFTANVVDFDIGANTTEYINLNAIPGQLYYYRVQTENVCGNYSTGAEVKSAKIAKQPTAPTSITTAPENNGIRISWTDNNDFETEHVVYRIENSIANEVARLGPNTTSYTDTGVELCVEYDYEIRAVAPCFENGISSVRVKGVLAPDLSQTFPNNGFDASKGYYPNRVVLNWETANDNLLNKVKIRRRILDSGDDFILIESDNVVSGTYSDYDIEAGVLYEYEIFGEGLCVNNPIESNRDTTIGFRNNVGRVTGNVSFGSGTAVEGVRISAKSTGEELGKSLRLDDGELWVTANDQFNEKNAILFETWVQVDDAEDYNLLYFHDNKFSIAIENGGVNVLAHGGSGPPKSADAPAGSIISNTYHHIAAQANQDSLQIFIDGILRDSEYIGPDFQLRDSNSPIKIGLQTHLFIDEVRIWNRTKTAEEIKRDYARTMVGNEDDLIVYLPMNEGKGNFAYDISRIGNSNYNKNHADFSTILGTLKWSENIPTSDQLSAKAYTDSQGNYEMIVPYNGIGESFRITPFFGIHEFDPNVTLVYLGDGAFVQNNVNFKDISFFPIEGNVSFYNPNPNTTSCPVAGVSVLVDGNLQYNEAGEPILSDEAGEFLIDVPIGRHYISLEKEGHIFSLGRFPAERDSLHNFLEALEPISFVDSTFRRVVGRVVGGLREGNKKMGLDLSNNNIGVANVTFKSELKDGCSTITVTTDETTGEFDTLLYPLRYTIENINIINDNENLKGRENGAIENAIGSLIDLSDRNTLTVVKDTTIGPADMINVDSVAYHLAFPVVIRNKPTITLAGDAEGETSFVGEEELVINESLTIPLNEDNSPIPFPVFQQNKTYNAHIFVNEVYRRYDAGGTVIMIDNTPSIGDLTIENEFDVQSYANNTVTIREGYFEYKFSAGEPSVDPLIDEGMPGDLFNYTQKLSLSFESGGVESVSYLPLEPILGFNQDQPNAYRAYVFGGKVEGANFTVAGPTGVDLILRDPPGSNSYATWQKDSTFTTAILETEGKYDDFNESVFGQIGFKFKFGLGISPGPETDFDQFLRETGNFAQKDRLTEDNEIIRTSTTKQTISTSASDSPEFVGGQGDVLVGTSTFQTYGEGKYLTTVSTDICDNPQVTCFGEEFNGVKLGFKPGIVSLPDSGLTEFVFTVFEIEDIVIPNLQSLRNNVFISSPNYYKANFVDEVNGNTCPTEMDDRIFASNNDDPHAWPSAVWTSDDPLSFEAPDTSGCSYTFFRELQKTETDKGIDSIRFYNNQIRLWKLALAKNEKQKYDVYQTADTVTNLSIGTAILERTYSSTLKERSRTTVEDQKLFETNTSFQALINNTGAGGNFAYSYTNITGERKDTTKLITNTFTYHIEDGNSGDIINVTVVDPEDGNSVVFRVNGGETSCPYWGDQLMHYYDVGNQGEPDSRVFASTYIDRDDNIYSPATVQRDQPRIAVAGETTLFNVPSEEAAVYQLVLTNQSGSEDDRDYELIIANNPNGAILEIDGLDPNQSFTIPYAFNEEGPVSVIKTLTLRRGATHFDHENIKLILRSPCDPDIFEEIAISAHFTPRCTDAYIYDPANNWVVNSLIAPKEDPSVPIQVQGYDYNFSNFKSLQFEYKASNEDDLSWKTPHTFYKNQEDLDNDQTGTGQLLPIDDEFVRFDWEVSQLNDGEYELRVVTTCDHPGHPNTKTESEPNVGVMDRLKPHPFGNPSPADGILDPNDEISIRFNEPIDLGSLTTIGECPNFDIRGVINGTEISHSTSLFFDGEKDYVEVFGGASLGRRDFTIEFSAKTTASTEQCIFSQGEDTAESLFVGFDAQGHFIFRMGNNNPIVSDAVYNDGQWRYFAVSYNQKEEEARLMIIDENPDPAIKIGEVFGNYQGGGVLWMGRNTVNNNNDFNGNLHGVRIWNTARNEDQFNVDKNKLLSGNEIGLLFNWRMDEAEGTLVKERVRRRDGEVVDATWQVEPAGFATEFDGIDDYIEINTGNIAISETMDFTLEFWFNSNQADSATLWSNGSGSATDLDAGKSWLIQKGMDDKIQLIHNGQSFTAVDEDYFDGEWHHLALVMKRNSNLSAYIDGNLANSTLADTYGELSGPSFYLGITGVQNGTGGVNTSQFYAGKMDEFRFWNAARKVEQIQRDKQNRMTGDEPALLRYLPFEAYEEDANGVAQLIATFEDQDLDTNTVIVNTLGGITTIVETPTIKLQRPVRDIPFDFSVNGDEVIFTPTIEAKLIENVTLDITARKVQDLQGNIMEDTEEWIAFVDRNQIVWQDDLFSFEKLINEELEFNSAVVNQGGQAKFFDILNIPEWLTVTPSSATIAPNSILPINFEVDPLVNIGNYIEDIQLLTDFGFAEKLTVELKVRDKEPEWEVNPADYEYSMSIIGEVRIKGILSTDEEDILAAFVGDEPRAKAKVRYFSTADADRYLVFMDVHSNNVSGEALSFKIWDASTGTIYSKVEVLPAEISFIENDIKGSLDNPYEFNANTEIEVAIPLNKGWNWVNHFLLNKDSINLDISLESLNADAEYLIKGQSDYSTFSEGGKWIGTLAEAGIRPEQMYKLLTSQADTLELKGDVLDPRTRTISLDSNWNWIGFISVRNQSIAQALGNLEANEGDLIKGENQFAVYNEGLGWLGSLETMVPGSGYMYKSKESNSFTYPLAGMFRNEPEAPKTYTTDFWSIEKGLYPNNMTMVVRFNQNCEFTLPSENYAIGLFDDVNNCRALMPVEADFEELSFLTVTGNSTEDLQFKLLNLEDGNEFLIGQSLRFEANQHLGSIDAPYQLDLSDETCTELEALEILKEVKMKVYPTIFRSRLNVDYYASGMDQEAYISLYNAQGQMQMQLAIDVIEGYNNIPVELGGYSISPGIYFLKLDANGASYSAKIIKN